jgi:6-phosphogluconolactonase (cycloisomerase 2 family)
MQQFKKNTRTFSVVVVTLLGCAVTSPAIEGSPLWEQVGVVRNGIGGVTALDGGYDIVMSNDGKFAYTAAYNSSAVTVFARDQQTGALTQQQVLQNNVAGVTGIGATRALRLSPDGQFLYAAGTTSNALAIFTRDALTGQLAFVSSFTNGGPLNGLSGVNALNLSNDGSFVYASSETNGSLSTFDRDGVTGALAYVQTLKDGVPPINSLATIRSFTISNDDRFLYAPARDDDKLTQFARDAASGELTVAQVISGGPNFSGPTHITFSPDGRHAYVTAQFSDSLSLFDVDGATGNLIFQTTYFDNSGGIQYLNHAEDVVVTADGQFVLVTATIDNALSVFQRDSVTGELTIYQQFRDGTEGIDGLFRPRELALSPDQRFVYVMSPEENAIAIFAIPEPTSLWLAALGSMGVVVFVRRRNGRKQ